MNYSQSSKLKFWNLRYFNGAVTLSGDYFYQNVSSLQFKSRINSTLYRGILDFRAENYIYHPNFIMINTELSYRPGSRSDEYIITPTRTQNTNSEKFSTTFYIFKQRPYNSSFYVNFDHSFVNRDFSTNTETYQSNAGIIINLANSYLPIRIKYDYKNWNQKELFYDRVFINKSSNLNLNANKTLFGGLNNKINFNYSSFDRKYSVSDTTIFSTNLDFNISSSAEIDAPLKTNINSFIWLLNRTGFDASSRVQIYENVVFDLPQNVKVYTNLQHSSSSYTQLNSMQNTFVLGANHKLYESLATFAEISFTDSKQNEATEKLPEAQIGFNYSKQIPTGTLNISYTYNREHKTKTSPQSLFIVKDESHALKDGDIVILDNPNVNGASIVVKNSDGTIVFREGLDYYLIERGQFFEIRRALGGQIAEGESVLIDYITVKEPSFSYTSLNQNLSVSLLLLENFIEIKYSQNNLKFTDENNTQNLALRNINRILYGLKFYYNDISVGYEKDDFNSNIIPYVSERYYLEFGYFEEGKFLASFTANYRDYYLKQDKQRQKFFDIVSRVSYMMGFFSKINVEWSYRFQKGFGIDLKLSTGKIEYFTNFRAVELSIGMEYFHRNYITELNDYFNGFMKIKRNF